MQQPNIYGPIVATLVATFWWLAPLALALALFKAFIPHLLGRLGEARVGTALRRLFAEVRNDVILPDGRGGLTQIDHLVLTPAGVLAVETKTYAGTILGQARESTWTQVLGRQRHSFQNPLRQNYAHVQALKALHLGIPVNGLVVFAGDARFPKGLPEGVCRASGLTAAVAPWRAGTVSPELRAAWEGVLAQARSDRATRDAHLQGLRERFGGAPGMSVWKVGVALLALGGLSLGVARWLIQAPARDFVSAPRSAPGSISVQTSPPLSQAPVQWRPAPTRTATSPKRSVRSTGPEPTGRVATLEWATPDVSASTNEACTLATTAVLIENTSENRRAQDRACGKPRAE